MRQARRSATLTAAAAALLFSTAAAFAQFHPDLNGSAEHFTDVYGYYYVITDGKFPPGWAGRNGDNASGGTMRYQLDDPGWGGYPLFQWNKDDWFPDNFSVALTLKNGGSIVFDNNGLEDGSYPTDYYTDYYTEGGAHDIHGLYMGYAMTNNWDWTYAGYFKLDAPTTFDTLIGYFDGNGYTGYWFQPVSYYSKYRMNIWTEDVGGGQLLPTYTADYVGDAFSSLLEPGTFKASYTGVDRVFLSGRHDQIWRVEYKLRTPVTLPAGEYYFQHAVEVCDEGFSPIDLNGVYFAPQGSFATPGGAYADTGAGDQVAETGGALEGTFTPFSDAVKPPVEYTGKNLNDPNGKFLFEVDLHSADLWTTPSGSYDDNEYFRVGLAGPDVGSGEERVWAVMYKNTAGNFVIDAQTDLGVASGSEYVAADDETQFHVECEKTATDFELTVWPLNGVNAGAHASVSVPLTGGDDTSSAWFFAGFTSYAEKSTAKATLCCFTTEAEQDVMYLHAGDPYVRTGDLIRYRLGHSNPAVAVLGFQAFLNNDNAAVQTFSYGNYSSWPFPTKIIDPITSALDLAAGVKPGDPAERYYFQFADLGFDAAMEGATGVSIKPDNGNPLIPTRLTDATGGPVIPIRVPSNTVVVDDTAPTLTGLTAAQSHGNVLNGAQPVIQGLVTICVDAQDVGPLTNGSGLACQPTISIPEFGIEDAPMYAAGGNTFCYEYTVGPTTPCGTANITINVSDDSENAATPATGTLTVNVTQISVDVQLAGVTATVTRCVEFVVGGTGGGNPPVGPIYKNVTFTAGAGSTMITALDSPAIPCGAGVTMISAKDTLHTLRTLVPLGGGPSFTADFTGANALRGGDANDDNLIDILDFGVFAWQFGATPGADTPCGTPYPHPDFSANGIVDTADYTFIQTQFLTIGDSEPGSYGPINQPRYKVRVSEMVKAGVPIAAKFDLNQDGWITVQEIAAWLWGGSKPPADGGSMGG